MINSDDRESVSEARSQAGNTHIAGELFVAAELAKRGYTVSLTMGNAKAVDLFAAKDGRAVCVQVKALSHKKNVGWPIPPKKHKVNRNVIYVCVILNDIGLNPSYYIIPPLDILDRGKFYNTRAILEISKVHDGDFLDAWYRIDDALQSATGPTFSTPPAA